MVTRIFRRKLHQTGAKKYSVVLRRIVGTENDLKDWFGTTNDFRPVRLVQRNKRGRSHIQCDYLVRTGFSEGSCR
jgi:hypothetical protein